MTKEILWDGKLEDYLRTQEQGITFISAVKVESKAVECCGNCVNWNHFWCMKKQDNFREDDHCQSWEARRER